MMSGTIGPAPMPCRIRNKTSASKLQAKPHKRAAPVKTARLRANRLRLPNRLPSQPAVPTNSVRLII